MANINSLLNQTPGTTTTGTTATTATKQSKIDASDLTGTTEQFLQILLAQLKHQDPLEPMKGTEFIDSISRLANVEQSINTNTHLEDIKDALKTNNSPTGNAVSYIDKIIEFNSSQFALENSNAAFAFDAGDTLPVKGFRLIIQDKDGNVVADNRITDTHTGVNTLKWDGMDYSGNQLEDGLYSVAIAYEDPLSTNQENPAYISVETFTAGRVTEANFTGEEPILSVGGIEIPLTAIRKLYGNNV